MNIKSTLKPFIPKKVLGFYHDIKYRSKETIFFQVHLTYHCNLKCKSCSHFSPLSGENYLDIKKFKKDMQRLSYLGRKNIRKIELLGGEPLLHPKINDFLKISRRYFPNTEIVLFTNGILLSEISDNFWKICGENNIIIVISYYPIKLNMDKINEKNIYNIKLIYDPNPTNRWFCHFKMDFAGTQNEDENIKLCYESKNCHCLDNGKMYLCYFPACIYIFNNFFDKNIPVCKDDYIDIYKAKNILEIIKYLEQPMKFCKFCDVKNRYGFKLETEWEISKKVIEEWT